MGENPGATRTPRVARSLDRRAGYFCAAFNKIGYLMSPFSSMKIWIICHHSPSLPLQMNFLMLCQWRKLSYDKTRMMPMVFGDIAWLDLLMGNLDLLKGRPSDPKRHAIGH